MSGPARERAHTSERFAFVVHAPLPEVVPLLGGDGERAWAPGWEPRFIWPHVAADRAGMVFEVDGPHGTATWINTAFDAGHVQYACVLPQVVATLITLELHACGADTEVAVHYERTALAPGADDIVLAMAAQDRVAGPEWARQIADYLQATAPH